MFQDEFQKFFESGITKFQEEKVYNDKEFKKSFKIVEKSIKTRVLTFDDLKAGFVIWLVAVLASIIVFIIETICFKLKLVKNQGSTTKVKTCRKAKKRKNKKKPKKTKQIHKSKIIDVKTFKIDLEIFFLDNLSMNIIIRNPDCKFNESKQTASDTKTKKLNQNRKLLQQIRIDHTPINHQPKIIVDDILSPVDIALISPITQSQIQNVKTLTSSSRDISAKRGPTHVTKNLPNSISRSQKNIINTEKMIQNCKRKQLEDE